MNRLPTFYDPRQSVEKNDSFSPSAGKPEKLIDHLKELNIPIDIVGFDACTHDDLKLVHDPDYIDGLMSGKVMNGFGNTSLAIVESVKWTAGSITAAAVYAYKNKRNTFSPTSGFHHASYHRGSAFCTVNGLMIAALKLIEAGAKKIAIIDLDAHYGNGQVEIIRKLKLENKVYNYCFSEHCQTTRQAEKWLVDLKKIISDLKHYDVIIYQAGADPYVHDPLSGILTMEQLKMRDHIVFSEAQKIGVPVVHNLAGGYTDPFSDVLKIHENTVLMSLEFPQTLYIESEA